MKYLRPTLAQKCDEIYDWLKDQILTGNIIYGQSIPSRKELALKFDINKKDVDEVYIYKKLTREGLIQLRDVKGQGSQRVVIYKSKHNHLVNKYNTCKKKAKYPSEKWANGVATRCGRERKIQLYSYKCPLCDGWHISSKDFNKTREEWTKQHEQENAQT